MTVKTNKNSNKANKKASRPTTRATRGSGPTHNTQEFSIVRLQRSVGPPGRQSQMTDGRMVSRQVNDEPLIEELVGSIAFSCQKQQFNPGLDNLSWLKDIARKYERYRLKRAYIQYTPSQATWDSPGKVILAAAYDPGNTECDSYSTICSYKSKVEGPIFQPLRLNIDIKRVMEASPIKAVRMGPVGGDLRLYDPFALHVATKDCADDTTAIGDVRVFYDLELRDPSTAAPLAEVPNGVMWVENVGNQSIPASGAWYNIDMQNDILTGDGVRLDDSSFLPPCGLYHCVAEVEVYDTDGKDKICHLEIRPRIDNGDLPMKEGSGTTQLLPMVNKQSGFAPTGDGLSICSSIRFIFQTDGSRELKMQGAYIKSGTFAAHFSGASCRLMMTPL